MSDTAEATISVLTPPGVGAIACLRVTGPRAWETIRSYFQPAGKGVLPDVPPARRFWFGTFGLEGHAGDEVIFSVKPDSFELHCHGGVRVVRWIVQLFLEQGFVERKHLNEGTLSPWDLLAKTPTIRTASVLLDQSQGAFRSALEHILAEWPNSAVMLERLAQLAPLGRHLIEPWRVVIAGPPNVGKSSLLNALAGYTRSIVAPVKGTTRDVVTAVLAFDGWPVELSDTAGLHDTSDALESAGIAKAEEQLRTADLVLWVKDPTEQETNHTHLPPGGGGRRASTAGGGDVFPNELIVWNKCDLATAPGNGIAVSTTTRQGIPELIATIVRRLIPREPEPLEAVPYSPTIADRIELAWQASRSGNSDAAHAILADCLADLE